MKIEINYLTPGFGFGVYRNKGEYRHKDSIEKIAHVTSWSFAIACITIHLIFGLENVKKK